MITKGIFRGGVSITGGQGEKIELMIYIFSFILYNLYY